MITIVTRQITEHIIRDRMPFGNFIEDEGSSINAISNESGDAQIEKFGTLEEAIAWLKL